MKVLGFCAGNGVMIHPFKKHLIGNVEPRTAFKTPGDKQWKANFPKVPLYRSLEDYMNTPEACGVQPDIIVGHPDCGHSSVLAYSRGKKMTSPKENKSLVEFINAIELLRPKLFLFENLPAMLKAYGEEDFKEVFKEYYLKIYKVPVTKFGNSQKTRIRLVIVGIRKDRSSKWMNVFKLYKEKPLKTTKELIGALPIVDFDLGHVREPNNTIITMFAGFKISLTDAQKRWVTELKDKQRWSTGENKMKNAPGVYKNLSNKPPLTVRKGNREFNYKGLMMSPRERARIQGIPDKFKIYIDPDNPGYWINKGRVTATKTPPYEVGLWFYKKVRKLKHLL